MPHQAVEIKDTVPLAVITRIASTSPLLIREDMRAALPAVVVAAPGTQAVWSVMLTVASESKSSVVSESSRTTVTFQPVELLVSTLKVVVAKTGLPGVSVEKLSVLTTKVSEEAAAVVKVLQVEESVKVPFPSGSLADAFHQYWVLAERAVWVRKLPWVPER